MSDIPTPFTGEPNLGTRERALSVIAGLVIAAAGLQRQGLWGLAAGLFGGALALRGAGGHCPVKAALASPGGTRQIAAAE